MQTHPHSPSHNPDNTFQENTTSNKGTIPTIHKRRQEIEELDAA